MTELLEKFKEQFTFGRNGSSGQTLSHKMTERKKDLFHISPEQARNMVALSLLVDPDDPDDPYGTFKNLIEHYTHNCDDQTFLAAIEAEKATNPYPVGSQEKPLTISQLK